MPCHRCHYYSSIKALFRSSLMVQHPTGCFCPDLVMDRIDFNAHLTIPFAPTCKPPISSLTSPQNFGLIQSRVGHMSII
jgi:hypothetical protein